MRRPATIPTTGRVLPGDHRVLAPLTTVTGDEVAVPAPGTVTHLQFRRFAGCPVCHLHLRSFARRHDELAAAGVREVVLFHTSADVLRPHVGDLPFAVVADPERRLYRAFGIVSSPRAVLDPRAWPTIVASVTVAAWGLVRHHRPLPPRHPEGGRLSLPADVLVDGDGAVMAAHYGVHADDQWSVDDVLALATTAR
jgi:peroxiredoxin